jgi:hypothetical protein
MKRILVLLALTLLITSCQLSAADDAVNLCRTSCDEIITALGRIPGTTDDVVNVVATNVDEAGQMSGILDELAAAVRRSQVNLEGAAPYQLADNILSSSGEKSDDFKNFITWATENEGVDFAGDFVCDYRTELIQSWIDPGWQTPEQITARWETLEYELQQRQIEKWDRGISLFCTLKEISSIY